MTSEPATDTPPPRRGRRRRRLLFGFLVVIALLVAGWQGLKWSSRASVAADAPLVGASLDTAWHARVGLSTTNYELALTRAGARLRDLLPGSGDPETILDQIDGLLLTGGGDVDPSLYDGDRDTAVLVDRERDDFEAALIRGAIARDMPILGICRGIQILNVVQGGSLRNLRDDPDLAAHHGIGLSSMSAHQVTIAEDSTLARLLGSGTLKVNSFHVQAVDRPGDGLAVTARAEDGVIEALELPGNRFVVCTQWHPEIPPQQTEVFAEFLRQVRDFREQRRGARKTARTPGPRD